ncbi:MAG TPA: hypothetical protein HPP80_06845, partial [Rhodospirillaceae bacterium]|nr:hypothetical protein [Rhodospirillaceae bacterium]
LCLLMLLTGCGKAGRPLPPPDNTYPQLYPNPKLAPTAAKQKDGKAEPPGWDAQDLQARFSPKGSYVDPSVEATLLSSPGRVLPASNLPNASSTGQQTPFDQGLSGASLSPLPAQPKDVPIGDEQSQ